MKLLIDTNIILDLLLKREPFQAEAVDLFLQIDNSNIIGYVSASAITDIFYIASKKLNKQQTISLIKKLLQIINVLSVSKDEINMALDSAWDDFEDSVQYSVAKINDMDYIITRNKKDFIESKIPIETPKEFLDAHLD